MTFVPLAPARPFPFFLACLDRTVVLIFVSSCFFSNRYFPPPFPFRSSFFFLSFEWWSSSGMRN